MNENKDFLSKQIITYLGNKRSLLGHIEKQVKRIHKKLSKEKMITLDLFSGSGVVARLLKKYSLELHTNDLETYSKLLNDVFLTNKNDFNEKLFDKYLTKINKKIESGFFVEDGIISKNYAPKNDESIKSNERVFFTSMNAKIIDTIRNEIDEIVKEKEMKKFFLASLVQKASVHNNTGGMFKGFYKDRKTNIGKFGGTNENALKRIKKKIQLEKPILSNYDCVSINHQMDSNKLVKKIKNIDITYIDPPYNQHPYGSNYFMLNLIINNVEKQNVSKISGIVSDWNRSKYNKRKKIYWIFNDLIKNLDSKYAIISYNSEGFLKEEEIKKILNTYGKCKTTKINYNTYRASRNLYSRNIHLKEYLFVLEKDNNVKFSTTKKK